MEEESPQKHFPIWIWGAIPAAILVVIFLYQTFTDNSIIQLFTGNNAQPSESANSPSPQESKQMSMPEPGDGEGYVEFKVGNGTFNLILPEGVQPEKIDVAPDEGFNTNLGNNRILTVYFAKESTEPGENCNDYTTAVLGDVDYTSGYYEVTHESGAKACVLNSLVSGNYIFEIGLFLDGSTYEIHTLSTNEAGSSYIPSGYLTIESEGQDSSTYIFADGFESGDTSAWSRSN